MFGLNKNTIDKIQSVFVTFSEIEEVIIYGSRAKGTQKKGSDIDLTIKGEKLNFSLLNKLDRQLDDLLLPYQIDLSLFDNIDNADLVSHINRVGKRFYP
ncbi:hypothetical protein MNBD_GAMMA06-51 [hydrothermal vent metagenome]|uniref:Polymerase beta nucleotidyltransferase domain-containing protein n=1 Tax=hydrothermal vent metagenome TaxID=652676 RepID=A0A3B0WD76_9ZZZZ